MAPTSARTQGVLASRFVASPVGTLGLVGSDRGLREINWATDRSCGPSVEHESAREAERLLDVVQRQLDEYFAGRRRVFEIPLDPVGTDFQLRAWKVLSTIPFGTTISYAEQAAALGDARKARAVGGANGRNPIPIVVPCHRVIGSDGSLTGFAVGVGIKKFLLDFESTQR